MKKRFVITLLAVSTLLTTHIVMAETESTTDIISKSTDERQPDLYDIQQPYGWILHNGAWIYVNKYGSLLTGWLNEGNFWYYLSSDGPLQTGWQKIDGTWYLFGNNGIMLTGWQYHNGSWYHLEKNGAMKTGWFLDKGTWYFLTSNGSMKTGWLLDCNSWYYFDPSGKLQTEWLLNNRSWYYLGHNGRMQTGWQIIEHNWYLLNPNGAMAKGWIHDGGYDYYLYTNGVMAANNWIGEYYVNGSGKWIPGYVSNPGKATLEKYRKIQKGMTYDQVVAIIGGPGKLLSEFNGTYFSSSLYEWEGTVEYSDLTVSFSDGIVDYFYQFCLV